MFNFRLLFSKLPHLRIFQVQPHPWTICHAYSSVQLLLWLYATCEVYKLKVAYNHSRSCTELYAWQIIQGALEKFLSEATCWITTKNSIHIKIPYKSSLWAFHYAMRVDTDHSANENQISEHDMFILLHQCAIWDSRDVLTHWGWRALILSTMVFTWKHTLRIRLSQDGSISCSTRDKYIDRMI